MINSTFNNATQLVNITATDNLMISNIWYNWNGTNITYTVPQLIKFNAGVNTIHAWAKDSAGNVGTTFANFSIDLTAPIITILSPNNTTYTTASQLVNITATDNVHVNTIWYNWNGTNLIYSTPQLITFNQGMNTLQVWANDTAGNIGTASVSFTVDLFGPLVQILSPSNLYYNNASQLLNITASDSHIVNTIWYNWNGTNVTYTTPQMITFNLGVNTINAWANNSLGLIGMASVTFTIDTSAPTVTIINPITTLYTMPWEVVNISAADNIQVNSIWYNWNGVNITYTGSQSIQFNPGNNTLTAWANDSAGNVGSNSVTFTINSFNTVWIAGTGQTIVLPLTASGTYNFVVTWGDGKSNYITTANHTSASHQYTTAGSYTINIAGIINGWRFDYGGSHGDLKYITQWGPLQLGDRRILFCWMPILADNYRP